MRLSAAAVAAIGVLALAGCGGADVQPTPTAAPSAGVTTSAGAAAAVAAVTPAATVPAAAIAAARQVVEPNSDGPFVLVRTETLTPAEAGRSATYQESDDIVDGTHGAPAYVITFRGTFVGRGLSHPAGSDPPGGRYFSVGIDGADMSVSGLSLSPDEPAPLHRR